MLLPTHLLLPDRLDQEEHEEEGELDLATLKEHEEATKVTP